MEHVKWSYVYVVKKLKLRDILVFFSEKSYLKSFLSVITSSVTFYSYTRLRE